MRWHRASNTANVTNSFHLDIQRCLSKLGTKKKNPDIDIVTFFIAKNYSRKLSSHFFSSPKFLVRYGVLSQGRLLFLELLLWQHCDLGVRRCSKKLLKNCFETVLYEQGLVPSTKTHLLRFIPSLWGHWWKSKNMEQPESRSFGAKIGWCFSIQCIHNTLRRCIYLEAHILQLLVLTNKW